MDRRWGSGSNGMVEDTITVAHQMGVRDRRPRAAQAHDARATGGTRHQGPRVLERGPVIPGKYAIDFTLDDTGKRHWLHPCERRRRDPRWAAIRKKHRPQHLPKKKP